jgi:hypothetical protein
LHSLKVIVPGDILVHPQSAFINNVCENSNRRRRGADDLDDTAGLQAETVCQARLWPYRNSSSELAGRLAPCESLFPVSSAALTRSGRAGSAEFDGYGMIINGDGCVTACSYNNQTALERKIDDPAIMRAVKALIIANRSTCPLFGTRHVQVSESSCDLELMPRLRVTSAYTFSARGERVSRRHLEFPSCGPYFHAKHPMTYYPENADISPMTVNP